MAINVAAEKRAYKKFVAYGMTPFGACGLIGNLEAESDGFYPNRAEYLCIKRLKENGVKDKSGSYYTQVSYTKALDSGELSCEEFLHPLPGKQYGYGLAQWTSPGRKAGLWNLAHQKGVSIADEDMQLEYVLYELENNYSSVLKVLKTATSIREASDVVLKKFEVPADTSEAVCASRAARGQKFYDDYVAEKPKGGTSNMTEAQLRQKVVGIAQGWLGCNESDGSHKKIIDTYNAHKPLARSYAVKYTDAWCSTFASAVAIVAELTEIIPTECGCQKHIELFKKLDSWVENDGYIPEPGDYIFYDWQDSGYGDNAGGADHVGIVEKVAGSTITVIEGNYSNAVKRRNLQVNGRYIRGYGVPKYESKADAKDEVVVSGDLKVGDVVNFTGTLHHTSSYTGAKALKCRSGKAKITAISKGKAHPYHLVAVSGGGSNVYGWVDAEDIEGAVGADTTIKVGDTVEYSGNVHFTSSYAGAKRRSCKGGTAKVTAIAKGRPHPYHLVSTEKGCTVHGWVDADKVTK